MNRDDIHIISRHSNWSVDSVEKVLKDEIYSDSKAWKMFLKLLFMSLGIGFAVAGIIFFFAYNWADLNKFAKIGMTEGLVVVLTLIYVISKLNITIKNIILTGTSVLVGVMIAVFGQIYQTGANAYDFFLGWTAFITLWVLIASYPPLWFVYLFLANTTFMLYTQQVASNWDSSFILNIHVFFNTIVLVISLYLPKFYEGFKVPIWFTNVIAFAVVSFTTVGISIGMFEEIEPSYLLLMLMTIVFYAAGLFYGLQNKRIFYLAIIPFSLIIIFSSLLIKISHEAGMFIMISLFIIGSVTLLIKGLIDIQKKWNNE